MIHPIVSRNSTRRDFIASAILGLALATVPVGDAPGSLVQYLRRVLARGSRNAPADISAARAIVFGAAHSVCTLDRLSDTEIAAQIRGNIAADYRAGRLASMAGWRVALTEVRAIELMRRARLV